MKWGEWKFMRLKVSIVSCQFGILLIGYRCSIAGNSTPGEAWHLSTVHSHYPCFDSGLQFTAVKRSYLLRCLWADCVQSQRQFIPQPEVLWSMAYVSDLMAGWLPRTDVSTQTMRMWGKDSCPKRISRGKSIPCLAVFCLDGSEYQVFHSRPRDCPQFGPAA